MLRKLSLCIAAVLGVSALLTLPALGAQLQCKKYKEQTGCAIPANALFTYTARGFGGYPTVDSVAFAGSHGGAHATRASLGIQSVFGCHQQFASRRGDPHLKGKLKFGSTLTLNMTYKQNEPGAVNVETLVGTVKILSAKTATLKVHTTLTLGGVPACDMQVTRTFKRVKQ